MPQCLWRSQHNLQELVLSSYHVSPTDGAWVTKLGGKPLCLLSVLSVCSLLDRASHWLETHQAG